MAFPIHAILDLPQQELTAITDSAARALLGVDFNDKALWDSAWTNDESCVFTFNGEDWVGMDAINKRIFDVIGVLDTSHHMSNVRVTHVSEDKKSAKFLAYVRAQHFPAGEGLLVDKEGRRNLDAAGYYYIDAVKDENDGLWKITKWFAKTLWFQGDMSVVAPKE